MIKAEIISHEGNPGPNWLDRCRTLATPGKTTAFVMVVAFSALLLLILQKDNATNIKDLPGAGASQQANKAPLTGLQVQPLTTVTPVDGTSAATVQPAAAGAPSASSGTDTSASDALGAKSTPSLNNSTNPSNASQKSESDQSQLNGKTLTNNVQSTIQNLNDKLKKPLGL